MLRSSDRSLKSLSIYHGIVHESTPLLARVGQIGKVFLYSLVTGESNCLKGGSLRIAEPMSVDWN